MVCLAMKMMCFKLLTEYLEIFEEGDTVINLLVVTAT